MSETDVLIIGAGPTGMMLALQLARRGIRFRIVAKTAGPAEASRATVVHARTLEFYRQLGFADEVVAAGIPLDGGHVMRDGREVARLLLGDDAVAETPYPFVLSYPQDDHERLLVRKLEELGVAMEWNTECVTVTQNADGVYACLLRDGSQEEVTARYVCGCDGAHSVVRKSIGVGFAGARYEQLFYVADATITGPEAARGMFMNLFSGGFVLVMPVRSSGTHRIIGIARDVPDDTTLTFEDVRATTERAMGGRATAVNWFSTYRVQHRVASSFRVGRCFLAGDAGHLHSPAGGQGMNTGIGDATNLAWKLAAVLRGEAHEKLLDTYDAERLPFAQTLVRTTDKGFQAMRARGMSGWLVRMLIVPKLMPLFMASARVRRGVFLTLAQLRITYRKSVLSTGCVGRVCGGDRLPWVREDETDNYTALESLQWQMHVYGAASEETRRIAKSAGLALNVYAYGSRARAAGIVRDAVYLVRPDGYVGAVERPQRAARVADYLRAHGVQLRKD